MTSDVTASTAAAATSSRRRGAHVLLWIVQVVGAVGFAGSALAKFSGAPQAVAVFEAMGAGTWMIYLVGVLEIAGAVGLLIPRLCGLAGSAFVALTLGAIGSHLIFGGSPAPATVMLVVALVIAIGRRHTTAELFDSVRAGK